MTFTPEQQLTIKALSDYIRESERLGKQMRELLDRSQIEGNTPEIVALKQQLAAEMNALVYPPGIRYSPRRCSNSHKPRDGRGGWVKANSIQTWNGSDTLSPEDRALVNDALNNLP